MPLGPFHPYQRMLPVAQHEMGHYVVARALGFRTGSVSIEILIGGGYRGGAEVTLSHALTSLDDVQDYLQRRAIVLYAGGTAEALTEHGSVDPQRAVDIIRTPGLGAEQDHAKARELIHLLRSVVHRETDPSQDVIVQTQLDELDESIFRQAVGLVELNAHRILGLAATLAGKMRPSDLKAEMTIAELEMLPLVQTIQPAERLGDRPT